MSLLGKILKVAQAALFYALLLGVPVVVCWPVVYVVWLRSHFERKKGLKIGPAQAHAAGRFHHGLAFLLVFFFFWLLMTISFAHVKYESWRVATRSRASAPDRDIMEVDVTLSEGVTRRQCQQCGIAAEDRSRHCYEGPNCCVPVYNHYCPWIRACIFAGNLKPYVLFLWATMLYMIVSVVIIVWTLVDCTGHNWIPHASALLVITAFMVPHAVTLYIMTMDIVFYNVMPKEDAAGIFVRVALSGYWPTVFEWYPGCEIPHPYDLGWRENAAHNLGEGWRKLWIFSAPPVAKVGPRFSEAFLAYARAHVVPVHQPDPSTRRQEASSESSALASPPGASEVRPRRHIIDV